jgi:hypothetical protein
LRLIIWKEISTAFEGRPIGGSWVVENGIVKVRTTLGEKIALLEEVNGIWVAWRLLRELAVKGKSVTATDVTLISNYTGNWTRRLL